MTRHTALLPIPDLLRGRGYDVVVLDGWAEAQGSGYYWQKGGYDSEPIGAILHGTGNRYAAPVVKDDRGRWSVANAWTGLSDDGGKTLTPDGDGTPTIVFTSAGPARYSSGYGVASVLDLIRQDKAPRSDADEPDSDTVAANRWLWSIENTHPNDGSDIDIGVYEMLVDVFGVVSSHFGWRDRLIFHRQWTTRKPVDPWFPGDADIQDDVVEEVTDLDCPWNPPCAAHFQLDEWGDDSKGVCNVPSWAFDAIKRQVARGVIITTDGSRDDFNEVLTTGRYWVFDDRGR